jgi:hypothetical protein
MALTCHIEKNRKAKCSLGTINHNKITRELQTRFEGSIITVILTHLLEPVLGGVDGNLHFPVPSMNRLNQTKPAIFSILPCWAFFKDYVFLYFIYFVSARMEDYCSNEISFIAYTVYQTKLHLTDNNLFEKRNPNHPYDRLGYCETTVKGWYTSFNKLMFYFEDINLDCDKGHLEFYAGERSFARIEGNNFHFKGFQ